MEIRRRLKSPKVKQCKIQTLLQLADFLELLFLQIALILFWRQLMEAMFFNHDLRKAINFISHVSQKQKKILIGYLAFSFLSKTLAKKLSDLPKMHEEY